MELAIESIIFLINIIILMILDFKTDTMNILVFILISTSIAFIEEIIVFILDKKSIIDKKCSIMVNIHTFYYELLIFVITKKLFYVLNIAIITIFFK